MNPPEPIPRDRFLPAPGEPWTPLLLTRWSGEYLRERGIENGRLEAELLLARVLGLRRLDLYLQHDRPLAPGELEAFKALLRRRSVREPLQYILGTAAFRDLELRTDARALVPRPETEVLVEEVLAWARKEEAPLVALELGTGTGAIALSLLREGPFRRVVATDLSGEALALAGENAEATGLAGGLELREGSLFAPLRSGELFDVVLSNPPYIPEGDSASLPPEVREWEPPGSLLAGPEGLDVLLPLARGSAPFLRPGGLLALEVGDGFQASRVGEALEEGGSFREILVRRDLAGKERVVLALRRDPQPA